MSRCIPGVKGEASFLKTGDHGSPPVADAVHRPHFGRHTASLGTEESVDPADVFLGVKKQPATKYNKRS